MLYLVSTPVGNLSDITLRALDTLKSCNYILCEDTRHSRILLDHYEISTPTKSFHQFSENAKEDSVIEDLKEGRQIALISDAGTPGISDPGFKLVKRCRQEEIPVTPIPGPCAAIAALVASGLETSKFQFIGFLPRAAQELKHTLLNALHYEGTTICYESPHRLPDLLQLLAALAPERRICIGRELTKKFEEFLQGPAAVIAEHTRETAFKGEITLLIAGDTDSRLNAWLDYPPKEHVEYLVREFRLPEKEAIKLAAELRGVPKKDIYRKAKID